MTLNAQQRAAVEAEDRILVVQAGAGSGKTRTLLARAERLARQGERVRLFAFTRAAAAELRQRLAPDLAERVEIATLHAHAAKICGAYLTRLDGFRDGWSILTEADDERIVRSARETADDPSQVRRTNGLVTYSELLSFGLRCLAEVEGARAELGGAALVDEAQDLTAIEWRYLTALAPEALTAVGDAAQAIYGWRGAQADVLAGPGAASHPVPRALLEGARWLPLPVNYRGHSEILAAANRLEIPGRVTLEADRGPGGQVRVERYAREEELLDELTGWGSALRETPGDWAILSRTRARLQGVAEALTAAGIPVHAPVLSGKVWEESPAARQLLDLLQVAVHPHDSLHLSWALSRVGMSKAQLLRAEVERSGLDACSLWNWVCVPGHLPAGGPGHQLLVQVSEARRQPTARQAATHLQQCGAVPPEAPVSEIPSDLTSAEFLLWLACPADRESEASTGEAVELATIHGAKGREWRRVLVLGCEEGHLPSGRGDLAEERRLTYVAVTRAKEELVLTTSRSRPGWRRGHTIESEPSRFVAELGL